MNILFFIANGLVMPPAMFFMANFYKLRGREISYNRLYISISIISLTALITSLQFIFPQIVTALDRNKDALLSGEIWRLITPLFVQPAGLWQCLFNGIFFLSFLPIAEHLFGRRLMLIYFGSGFVGQLANYYWNKGGGGSSTAIYGVIGALFMYLLLHRKAFPKGYILIPLAGFIGSIVLVFFKDGHAPGLLMGGILSLALHQRTGSSQKMEPQIQH